MKQIILALTLWLVAWPAHAQASGQIFAEDFENVPQGGACNGVNVQQIVNNALGL